MLESGTILSSFDGDNCISSRDIVFLIKNILQHPLSKGLYLVVQQFMEQKDFYTWPTASSNLGIYAVSKLNSNYTTIPFTEFQRKYVLLPHDSFSLAIPMH